MFKFPKLFVFFLAVVVGFVLYHQSLKLNPEHQILQKIGENCRLYGYTESNSNYYFRKQIYSNYGVPIESIVSQKNQKLLFFNVFIVCLIVQSFAVFAAVEREFFISVISMLPLFLFVSTSREGWLVPAYLVLIPGFAYLFARLKRLIFNEITNWFT